MKEKQRISVCNKLELSGVITVEMSYLIPTILILFMMIIYITFYYHDKNILIGAASETAALGSQLERAPGNDGQADLAGFYQERIQGKLVLFSGADASVSIEKKWVEVSAYAERGGMSLHVVQRAALQEPEVAIRRKWMVEKAIDKVKEKKEEVTDSSDAVDDKNNGQLQIEQKGTGQTSSSQRKMGKSGRSTVKGSK